MLAQQDPKVSIIIPAYKGRSTIPACLQALMTAVAGISHQIIMVESSGDGSVELVRQSFPDVEVIASTTPLTAGQARNLGIGQARGRFLFCLDQDCLVPPDWIARLLHHLNDPAAAAAGGSMAVANTGNLSGWCVYFLEFLYHFPSRAARLRDDTFLVAANSAWKSELFQIVSFPDQTLGEDRLLSEAVKQLGLKVIQDPTISVHHHNRTGWREFLRYCRAMGSSAADDQQRLGGRWIGLIERVPRLVYAVPLVVLPLIGWRLLMAPPGYLLRYLLLLPCCLVGQLVWAKAFRQRILSRGSTWPGEQPSGEPTLLRGVDGVPIR